MAPSSLCCQALPSADAPLLSTVLAVLGRAASCHPVCTAIAVKVLAWMFSATRRLYAYALRHRDIFAYSATVSYALDGHPGFFAYAATCAYGLDGHLAFLLKEAMPHSAERNAEVA